MSWVEVRERSRDSPLRARSLLTVRAAISSARSSLRPWSRCDFLMCSYWRARLVPGLTPRGGMPRRYPAAMRQNSTGDERRRAQRDVVDQPLSLGQGEAHAPMADGLADGLGLRGGVNGDAVPAAPVLDGVGGPGRQGQDAAPVGAGGVPGEEPVGDRETAGGRGRVGCPDGDGV